MRVTGCELLVHGFYSQFDVLNELSIEIIDNIKYGRGILFHNLFEESHSKDEFDMGSLSCPIIEGPAYYGQRWGEVGQQRL